MEKYKSNLSGKCLVCRIKLSPFIWKDRKRIHYKKYCSSHCEWLAIKEEYQKSKSWLKRKNLWRWKKERKCILCGKTFIPRKVHQKYCLNKCDAKKAWKKKNWDKVLEWQRNWFKRKRIENPERFRQFVRNRKSRIKAGKGKITLLQWEKVKKKQNYICLYCRKKEPEIKLTIDHIIPITKGGKHSIENIQALCSSCNSKKNNKLNFIPHTSSGDSSAPTS